MSAFFSMVDGKAANAIVDRGLSSHDCAVCIEGPDALFGPSYYHCRLNTVEWLVRVAAQKMVPGKKPQASKEVQDMIRALADRLEDHFKVQVNRARRGGGSSNNGNMARRLLTDPEAFASILSVGKPLIENVRLISCLALSSHKLDAVKVEKLFAVLEKQLFNEFPVIRKLPPSVHKYSHLPMYIRTLVMCNFCLFFICSLNNICYSRTH